MFTTLNIRLNITVRIWQLIMLDKKHSEKRKTEDKNQYESLGLSLWCCESFTLQSSWETSMDYMNNWNWTESIDGSHLVIAQASTLIYVHLNSQGFRHLCQLCNKLWHPSRSVIQNPVAKVEAFASGGSFAEVCILPMVLAEKVKGGFCGKTWMFLIYPRYLIKGFCFVFIKVSNKQCSQLF